MYWVPYILYLTLTLNVASIFLIGTTYIFWEPLDDDSFSRTQALPVHPRAMGAFGSPFPSTRCCEWSVFGSRRRETTNDYKDYYKFTRCDFSQCGSLNPDYDVEAARVNKTSMRPSSKDAVYVYDKDSSQEKSYEERTSRRTFTEKKSSIHTPSIHTPSIHTPSIHTPSIHTPSIHTPSIHTPSNGNCTTETPLITPSREYTPQPFWGEEEQELLEDNEPYDYTEDIERNSHFSTLLSEILPGIQHGSAGILSKIEDVISNLHRQFDLVLDGIPVMSPAEISTLSLPILSFSINPSTDPCTDHYTKPSTDPSTTPRDTLSSMLVSTLVSFQHELPQEVVPRSWTCEDEKALQNLKSYIIQGVAKHTTSNLQDLQISHEDTVVLKWLILNYSHHQEIVQYLMSVLHLD